MLIALFGDPAHALLSAGRVLPGPKPDPSGQFTAILKDHGIAGIIGQQACAFLEDQGWKVFENTTEQLRLN